MRLNDTLFSYLRGEQFSNGLRAEFTFDQSDYVLHSRISWLTERCRGRRVVHVGCVDHDIAMVEHKRARGKWLHGELMEAAERVLGVDIDAEGLAALEQKFGIDDLLSANLLTDPCEPIFAEKWDIMLLAEVLEHIGDPVTFLRTLRERFGGVANEFIITVPNAFAEEIVAAARNGTEVVNSDHRFWFTPYTIAKLCIDAGLVPEEVVLCRNGVIKRRSLLKNRRLAARPFTRNNIIVRARA
ncbi:MAG: methyltransferase domain-containing protein [Pseudomonadota bacterium]